MANMHPVSRVKNTASARYWEEREQKWIEANKKSDEVRAKQIEYLIDRTMNRCNREIEAFYSRYAKKNEMTIADAKKAVKSADIDYLAQKAKEYVANKDFSEQANAEMALYNLTMKVNRLEWLKANLGMEITSSMSEMQKYFEDSLSEETLKSFEHYSGILGKTVHHPADRAKTIIDASWQTAKWSDNIWQYQASLKYHLYDLLQQNLIQGRHPNVLARELKKAFEVTKYQAERLMRTETARVQTQAAGESLTANGYDHFIFIADMSERTCPTCFGLNGSVGAVKDLKSGTNAPPIHPNCRCSIAAYMPDDEFKKWLASKSKEKAEEKPEESIKTANVLEKPVDSEKNPQYTELKQGLEVNNVVYDPVLDHAEQLSDEEIIEALAGGDRTRGSCASLGLAYIGQRQGWNVLDFRDGESRSFFSRAGHLCTLASMDGMKGLFYGDVKGKSSCTLANNFLKQCEIGKEYYLCVGRHASIVRKNEDGVLQYLELQSATKSGWTKFNGNPRYTLTTRFGCSSSSGHGEKYDFMLNITDSDFNTDEFRSLLGYINTDEKSQVKGHGGTIK